MKVALTGATGFVGQHILNALHKFNVTVIGRRKPSAFFNGQFFHADINPHVNYEEALSGIDVVVHSAARAHIMDDKASAPLDAFRKVNTVGTLNLAKQAAGLGVRRFIFISSIKVNGEGTSNLLPYTYSDNNAPEDPYGISKAEAEQQLLELGCATGMEIVIIRPPLVYGPGVKANFASLLNLVSKGIPLPFGCINDNKRSLVSVTYLVDLIVTCIEHPKAAGQIFLVSDDHDVSTSEMVGLMAKSLSVFSWQLPVPRWLYRFIGKATGKTDVIERLLGSLQVDISHTKETLNWTPPQTIEQGFLETAQSFVQSKNK